MKHEGDASNGSDGVGDTQGLDIGGGAMTGFTDDETIADVGGGDETEGADQGGGAVGEDISVKVGSDDDVVAGRLSEELVDHGVDDLFVDFDRGVSGAGQRLTDHLAEETVGLAEHVTLVRDGHARCQMVRCWGGSGGGDGGRGNLRRPSDRLTLRLTSKRKFACHDADPMRGSFRDPFDGLRHPAGRFTAIVASFFLDVQILGVLSGNNEVDRG